MIKLFSQALADRPADRSIQSLNLSTLPQPWREFPRLTLDTQVFPSDEEVDQDSALSGPSGSRLKYYTIRSLKIGLF